MLVGAGLNVSVLEMKIGAQNLYQLNVTHINRQGEFLPEIEPSPLHSCSHPATPDAR